MEIEDWGLFLFMAKRPSTEEILKAYEKFGDQATVANLFGIEDWEVLAALAKAPPEFLLGLYSARALDTALEALRHLRKRIKTARAPTAAGVARDLGKLVLDLQAKRKAVSGEASSGLGLSEEEERRLTKTINALGDHDDSDADEAED